jgi:sortase A
MRRLAAGLALAGTAGLVWTAVALIWGDPFTALLTSRAQAQLRRELAGEITVMPARSTTSNGRATSFRRALRDGAAYGDLVIPRIHLHIVVVQGTSETDLERGVGHYAITSSPGFNGTIAIAGHRTTYLAPFRHIDELRRGDRIYLRMPYGTFRYVVYGRAIVDSHDWSILRRHRFETLVLSACHPLYSASHRIVVFGAATRSAAWQRPSGKLRATQPTN